jgi:hypothetical protein
MAKPNPFASLTNRELVAYYNILTMGSHMLASEETRHLQSGHLFLVKMELSRREIPQEDAKLINVESIC